eukprot:TRINITY_DN4633_c0_g1_i16.p1 TRINITY_DN4633_c0_g1~~TRINITY_DN4633_c0_g1_i16.p1  ORF type:complete len:388 (-),score=22.01 TRINITY_DN4633_c0_g1_i16:648-1811(-)
MSSEASNGNGCNTRCWACNVELLVPEIAEGQYAHEYKCGWCGAFNYWPLTNGSGALPPKHTTNGATYTYQKQYNRGFLGYLDRIFDRAESCVDTVFPDSCLVVLNAAMRGTIFIIVIILVFSMGVVGPVVLLPGIFEGWRKWLTQGISAFLFYNVAFNFVASSMRDAGNVADYFQTIRTEVQQYSFDNFKYCARCKEVKPPSAHHCRICGKCVVDMDHHCPFINNCVGRSNLRSFILFLIWILLSVLYALPFLLLYLFIHRQIIFQTYNAVSRYYSRLLGWSSILSIAPGILIQLAHTNWRILLAIYLTLICAVSVLAVGFLLHGQLSLALRGEYYINTLQSGQRTISYSYSFRNLQRVFGNEKPIFWLLPRWQNPCILERQQKKGS